ncbi:MAG: GntR family transcriptional regulator [Bacteroides sp.]|nr:GntR family transcriptional regulator [Bacteroides sp.]
MEFKGTKPIYLQITDGIMDQILDGTYPLNSRLPSVRDYATKVEVNANTVMRAYDWLQQQKIIFNRRGIGFFILPEAHKRILEMRRNIFFHDEATYFFSRLKSFGLSVDEVANLYKQYLENPMETNKINDLD